MGIYFGDMVTGVFRLDSELFKYGSENAAYLIWEKMIVLANVGLVIFFLIVILSQITGYGIDNYGVKRILPKIIIAAVLINLSFPICQVMVDLSNIIGHGIVDMARTIRDEVAAAQSADFAEVTFGGLFTVLFGASAGITMASGVLFAVIGAGPLWFIPLILVCLAAIVAFIMFFVLLAGRQILAVILVTVSPLAMLCYALPNTQKIFKKWTELFKAILIIYPVCGALYGVAELAKAISYRAEGMHIMMIMVAMLMTFLPLYAAPKLIKKSIAGFNMIGDMLTSMGDKARGGIKQADNVFKNSEMYKDAQRRGMLNRAEKNMKAYEAVKKARAGTGKATFRQKLRSRISGGEMGYARNAATVERLGAEYNASTIAAMRGETGNYNTDIMERNLANTFKDLDSYETDSNGTEWKRVRDANGNFTGERVLAQKSERAESEKKARALMSKIATSRGGGKILARLASEGGSNTSELMAKHASTDDSVSKAIAGKSMLTSQRLEDVAAGVVNAGMSQDDYNNMNNQYLKYLREQKADGAEALSYDDWGQREHNANRTVDNTTVIQNTARNVLDKDKELVTQTGADVKALMGHLSEERILKIADNHTLFSYGDIADGVEKAFKERAAQIRTTRAQAGRNDGRQDDYIPE